MRELKQGGLLSVVLPSYNEEASIPRAAERITQLLTAADIPFELLFVDDGSKDGSWAAIQTQAARFPQVRGVRFSRNFGKEAAIFAGLAQARGDCAAVMDCDLQHPPEKLEEMYRLWQQGYQVIEGVKVSRGKESPLHAFAAHRFYDILSRVTGVDMSRASDFKLLDRKAVDTLVALREKNAFFRALSSWIGFSTATVEFEVQPRVADESGALRRHQHRRLLHRTSADRHPAGECGLSGLGGAGAALPVAEVHRPRSGGLYHGDIAPAAHRQHSDDLSGHHRLLYRQDL